MHIIHSSYNYARSVPRHTSDSSTISFSEDKQAFSTMLDRNHIRKMNIQSCNAFWFPTKKINISVMKLLNFRKQNYFNIYDIRDGWISD